MKIAIVNAAPPAVEAIRRVLAGTARYQVTWVARDGGEAVRKCAQDRPDLILMDMMLPVLNGVEATRLIMAQTPCAILVVTARVAGMTAKVFEALGAGALDAINTPQPGGGSPDGSTALLRKIEMIEKLISDPGRTKSIPPAPVQRKSPARNETYLVAIGASAGGPMALAELLACLPFDFPAAVIIVQHVDPLFAPGMAAWLNEHSAIPVRLAMEGDKPVKGTVLLAGTGDHLAFINATTLGYTPDPIDYVYRPSVDVFFQSVVKHWRGEAVGVLLTGMGRDGALGLKQLRDAGRHTIAQDADSSLVYGMPKAAAALGAADEILPLPQIGLTLRKICVQ
jgi:chemotaxis response regulator CheB